MEWVLMLVMVMIFALAFGHFHKGKFTLGKSIDEGFSSINLYHPIDTRYWPNYFYTYPYEYRDAGAWPPDMQTRMVNWYPGFSSGSGWYFEMRPGVHYKTWARDRWVRKKGDHYTINQGKAPIDPYRGDP